MPLSMTVSEAVDCIAAHIDEWQAEAGMAAQVAQHPEAGDECLKRSLREIVEAVAERSARACEGRGSVEDKVFAIRAEANKCAAQIRFVHGIRERA